MTLNFTTDHDGITRCRLGGYAILPSSKTRGEPSFTAWYQRGTPMQDFIARKRTREEAIQACTDHAARLTHTQPQESSHGQ